MKQVLGILILWLVTPNLSADDKLMVAEFSRHQIDGWEQKKFKGESHYQLQQLDTITALRADSKAAASGLFKEQRIDLDKTPFLNWSWRVAKRPPGLNEQSKAGDDYAARLYIVIKGGLAFWQTKAINYVFASNSRQDSNWTNAFAGKSAMMIAIRGTEAEVNHWYHEKRNIKTDIAQQFGEQAHYIDAVALMTDTDNSNSEATAFYGDIWFSKN